jgi:divalent metal cation (Fe/Co/Zn/Cd) transporter
MGIASETGLEEAHQLAHAAETALANVVPKLRTALVHAYPAKTAADGAAQHVG